MILHPGKIIAEIITSKEGLNISIPAAARHLRVDHVTLYRLINGRANLSPNMAFRLSKLIPSLDVNFWMNLQKDYDIEDTKKRNKKVRINPLTISNSEFLEKILKRANNP